MNSAALAAALSRSYRVERELGQGGMATVYLAHDLKHDRMVAIKVLRAELAEAIGAERFLAEIKTTANLQHPHILPLFDSGMIPGGQASAEILFYVMPFIEGESLRDRLDRERQLPIEEALLITREVNDALGYAHSRGIVHRDIKPENILLANGHALVADFGIARAIGAAGGSRLTGTGLSLGTPAYMSPEQSMAEDVDGRSDVYAMGSVLYEMLVGEPPYTGPSAQAIIARRLSTPVPSLRVVREAVPVAVERAVIKALARVPADRYATAAQFSAALAARPADVTRAVETAAAHPVAGRRWRGVSVAILAVALMVSAVLWWRGRAPSATLDPDLLVITPFEVHENSLQLWHEGLVDVLSRNLDGAGPLRTVPLSVVLRRWTGPADRGTALALARQTGAGLVAFGDIASRGVDSVSLRLTLLDVATSKTTGEAEVSGNVDRIPDLADSLGRHLLTTLGRQRPIAAVRKGSLGAASLPALKAFLHGEYFYRRGLWDSALVYYDQATTEDPSFALALRRMTLVLGWGSPTASQYKVPADYTRLNQGQAPRDSLLIASDSADNAGDAAEKTDLATFLRMHRRSMSLRQEAARLYPGDPEVWYELGETLFHFPPQFRGTSTEALEAFDHSIALDSGFAPAYEHAPALAMETGGVELTRRYLAAYLKLDPTEDFAPNLRFDAKVFDPGMDSLELNRLLDTVPEGQLGEAFVIASWWPDTAEMAIRLCRTWQQRQADSPWRQQILATQLAIRGHLRDAWRLYDDSVRPRLWSDGGNSFPELALLGAVPPDSAAKIFGEVLDPGAAWPPQWQSLGLAWWSARGDTASLVRFIARANQEAPRDTIQRDSSMIRYLGDAASAYLALARHDSVTALRSFETLPDSLCGFQVPPTCLFQKFTQARLEVARREDRKAAETINRWVAENWERRFPTPVIVLARLERAGIAERLNDRELAIRYYQFVADIWRKADPSLMPYVNEARAGLQRLTAEGSR